MGVYSFLSFRSAFTENHALEATVETKDSLTKALAMCLAFTWLNPHVYLDTVVLLGSISTQYQPNQMLFGAGAVSASFVFFFSLGYGARFLVQCLRTRGVEGVGICRWRDHGIHCNIFDRLAARI